MSLSDCSLFCSAVQWLYSRGLGNRCKEAATRDTHLQGSSILCSTAFTERRNCCFMWYSTQNLYGTGCRKLDFFLVGGGGEPKELLWPLLLLSICILNILQILRYPWNVCTSDPTLSSLLAAVSSWCSSAPSNSIQPTFKPCRVSVWSSKHKFVVKSSGDQI